MSKEEWKEAGTGLGHAWRDFGKTMIRSADRVVEKAKEPDTTVTEENGETIVDVPENNGTVKPDSTVFSDGSWKKTMKGLGNAFKGVGKATLNSISELAEESDSSDGYDDLNDYDDQQ